MGQKALREDIQQIKDSHTSFSRQLETFHKKMEEIQDTLRTVPQNKAKIDRLEVVLQSVESTVRSQARKLVDLEDRSRRNNLLVFGIQEDRNETEEELRKKVLLDVFDKRLGVKVNTVERIHRLGKKREDKTRPVIMRLFDYNEKTAVFDNCKKLKGCEISVSSDYSQATLEKRRNLWESAKMEKSRGSKVRLSHDRIVIDDVTYCWDDEKNCRTKVDKKRPKADESP